MISCVHPSLLEWLLLLLSTVAPPQLGETGGREGQKEGGDTRTGRVQGRNAAVHVWKVALTTKNLRSLLYYPFFVDVLRPSLLWLEEALLLLSVFAVWSRRFVHPPVFCAHVSLFSSIRLKRVVR